MFIRPINHVTISLYLLEPIICRAEALTKLFGLCKDCTSYNIFYSYATCNVYIYMYVYMLYVIKIGQPLPTLST